MTLPDGQVVKGNGIGENFGVCSSSSRKAGFSRLTKITVSTIVVHYETFISSFDKKIIWLL